MKGKLIVVSGYSGAGKGTVVKRLVEKYPGYALSVSATTRVQRENEIPGVSYFYVSREEFEQMIAQDELVEYAQYLNNYYGTPKAYVEEQRNAGKNVILEIEAQGALQIKEKFPETLLVFVNVSDWEELRRRLTERSTESGEEIERRITRAKEESAYIPKYDIVVENRRGELEACVDDIHTAVSR